MSLIEITAAVFGFLSVWFYIHRNPSSWPTGLVQVVLLWFVFWQAKLYADLGLHVVYAGLQIYGWHAWRTSHAHPPTTLAADTQARSTPTEAAIVVRSLKLPGHLLAIAIITLGTGLLAWCLMHYTDAELPVFDSLIAAMSIVAQMLLAWRYLENWLYWILVDIVGIGVFAYKGLYPTTALYILFLFMAMYGYRTWRNTIPISHHPVPMT